MVTLKSSKILPPLLFYALTVTLSHAGWRSAIPLFVLKSFKNSPNFTFIEQLPALAAANGYIFFRFSSILIYSSISNFLNFLLIFYLEFLIHFDLNKSVNMNNISYPGDSILYFSQCKNISQCPECNLNEYSSWFSQIYDY